MKTKMLLALLLALAGSAVSKSQTVSFSLSSCAHSGPAILQGSNWTGLAPGDTWSCTIMVPGVPGTMTDANGVMFAPYLLSVEGTAESSTGASLHVESPAGTTVGTLKIPDTVSWVYRHHREQQWQQFVHESFGWVLLPGGTDPFILVVDAGGATLADALTVTDSDPVNIPLPGVARLVSQQNTQDRFDPTNTAFLLGYGDNNASEGNGSHTEQVVSALSLQERQNGIYAIDGDYTVKLSVKSFFFSYPGYGTITLSMGPQNCTASGCAPVPCPIGGPLVDPGSGVPSPCNFANPGSQEICSRDIGWPNADYSDVTFTCTNHRYLVLDQSLSLPGVPPAMWTSRLPITITFFTPGWPVYYKDVSLTFTPKPLGTCAPLVPPIYGACQP